MHVSHLLRNDVEGKHNLILSFFFLNFHDYYSFFVLFSLPKHTHTHTHPVNAHKKGAAQ